jgi:FixJ family two-component response regulator
MGGPARRRRRVQALRVANCPIVMISGHGNIEAAVSAIKRGAEDFKGISSCQKKSYQICEQ